MITPEQRNQLREVGKKICRIFPNMFGNVFFRFNLRPGRKDINVNVGLDESYIIKDEDPNK